jgi:hypothetical protein
MAGVHPFNLTIQFGIPTFRHNPTSRFSRQDSPEGTAPSKFLCQAAAPTEPEPHASYESLSQPQIFQGDDANSETFEHDFDVKRDRLG